MRGPGIVTITDGLIEIELLPDVGARLHRLRVFGQDLLRTPDDVSAHLRDPFRWGAYLMAPWCNRIAAGATVVDGQLVALAANFEDGTAIHGQLYSAPWQLGPDLALSVRGGGDGWPWPYECRLRVAATDAVLTIEQSLTNLAPTRMPAGIGLHPWFRRPLHVRIDAQSVIPSNTDPHAGVEPVAGSLDLRTLLPMPPGLDAAWLDLGDPPVDLLWPELGITASLRARTDGMLCVVAASPPGLDAIAIEPQSHAPFGLDRFIRGQPGAMIGLAPQATLRLTTELAFGRTQAQSRSA